MRRSGPETITQSPGRAAYQAAPEIERQLLLDRTVTIRGGRYSATVARAGPNYYEAWTESPPFVYGRSASTLQGALDSLEERYRDEVEK